MENIDTSGFYKQDGDLLYAPNYALNANYELRKESHTEYSYPVDGWYWFDSEVEAKEYFNIPNTEPVEE